MGSNSPQNDEDGLKRTQPYTSSERSAEQIRFVNLVIDHLMDNGVLDIKRKINGPDSIDLAF